ncbi:LCP family protein [Enterococcus saccharolyticus]|uniref:Polyisoprenyl-teichoic acid--peptidoglycan teichoic acid transferase TagU n=1 Tax=Enterococcus saccharolyticus subsp. saccharolyticus ATCC 43076 TaxID=1139996 RepID=S0NR47_9ENTE|nr:LCP family protein [Enterococcus saccharolyticus]EOT30769.1 transcriptional regulator [Enterococcus saccharolyticus subsp. saccharolyticus ATCC 43076]EOT80330.1 transcriptional regulator [Enterococcus saccharolyticus subsp. saccharolyticus ATCC 43076]OJG85676.1 transcriptional regulator [Enterococcus saccharolyticus]
MSRRSRRSSRGKKVFLTIFAIVAALVVIAAGVGAKLYFDLSGSIKQTYEAVERKNTETKKRQQPVDLNKKEPFSVLLLGIDTGDLGRTEQGRSDTLMVATVNPNDNKTTLVSVPRDTYVDIVGYGTQDKINHAYAFGGAAMSMDTVEKYLDIPIDHYVSINMMGIKELVDALGGVDVNNDLEFESRGEHYAFGPIHLEGERVLTYLRMRYEDPRGDYGRQLRQRAVVEAVVKKVLTLDGVTQYRNILDAMEGNMKTDMNFNDMQKIALDYRSAFTTIDQLQMQGDGFMQDGVSYQRVSDEELQSVQNKLKKQLNTK